MGPKTVQGKGEESERVCEIVGECGEEGEECGQCFVKNMVDFPALGSSCSTRLHGIVRASQLINDNFDDCQSRRSMPSEIDATTLSISLA